METMLFMRGDGNDHTFALPAANWTAGGRLFFAAKPAIADDDDDSTALIQGDWGNESVTDILINGVAYKQYRCHFPASSTNDIDSQGAESTQYLGEFEFVPFPGADPFTYPGAGQDRIPVELWFDVKRKVTT